MASSITDMFGAAKRIAGGEVGEVPALLGNAMMAPINFAGDMLNAASMHPLGQAVARGAVGASGGMPAVAEMAAMQQEAAYQQMAMRKQQQLQMELEQAFQGRPFNPNDRESMNTFLQVFGRHFPEKLPEAAAKIGSLFKEQTLKFMQGPNNSIYSLDPMQGTAKQVVAGETPAAKDWEIKSAGKGLYRVNKATGQMETLVQPPQQGAEDADLATKQLTQVREMKTSWENSPKMRAYGDIQRNGAAIESAYGDFVKTGNPQSFLVAVNSFAHMLDPGSTVREADFENIDRMVAIVNRVKQKYDLAVKGQASPEVMKTIMQESRVLAQSAAQGIQPEWHGYKRTASYWADRLQVPPETFTEGLHDIDADADRFTPGPKKKLGHRTAPEGFHFTGEIDPETGQYELMQD